MRCQTMKGHAAPKMHSPMWRKAIWRTYMVSDCNYMALGEVAGWTACQSTQEATEHTNAMWTLVQTGFWVTKTLICTHHHTGPISWERLAAEKTLLSWELLGNLCVFQFSSGPTPCQITSKNNEPLEKLQWGPGGRRTKRLPAVKTQRRG